MQFRCLNLLVAPALLSRTQCGKLQLCEGEKFVINQLSPSAHALAFTLRIKSRWRMPMFKLALVIWVMLGTVLAGTAVLVVLMDQSLLNQGAKTIPIAAVAGFILALPLSFLVSKRIS
jgi:hypothetical protein